MAQRRSPGSPSSRHIESVTEGRAAIAPVELPPERRPDRTAVVRLGLRRRRWDDIYHQSLIATWPRFLAVIGLVYCAINAGFAAAYMTCGSCLENARPGSFADAFFFSVQTFATIGYGRMTPQGLLANTLVSLEALVGLLSVAMATGLMFSRFSRPTARVIFSRHPCFARRDGVPSLVFRLANYRGNQIVEARIGVVVLMDDTTAEGERFRRVLDVPLVRSYTPAFSLSLTAVHPIDGRSPFQGATAETLAARNTTLVCTVAGLDETSSQNIHARQSWTYSELRWGARPADTLLTLPDGRRAIDYTRFHDLVPADWGEA